MNAFGNIARMTGALLLSVWFAQPAVGQHLPREFVEVAELMQRYPTGTIYLGPPALNDIRSILREPIQRKKINSRLEPIPLGAKTLEEYIDTIFKSSLDSTQGVLVLMVDFRRSKAYEKRASDTSGGAIPLPWVPQEVRAVALLSDELLRSKAKYYSLIDLLRDGKLNPTASWKEVEILTEEHFIADENLSTYVQLLVSKLKKNGDELKSARTSDPVAYKQMQALLANQASVDMAATDLVASEPLRGCFVGATVSSGYSMFEKSAECRAFQKAAVALAKDSFVASKNFVVLSDLEAKQNMYKKFAAELKAGRE